MKINPLPDGLTPEMMTAADAVARRLIGYTEDIETAVNEMADEGLIPWGYHTAPRPFFGRLDSRAWPCAQCDVWHPPIDLDDNEECIGCRKTEAEIEWEAEHG